eukprot:4061898-Pleurochrysis_carterae.AAC.1
MLAQPDLILARRSRGSDLELFNYCTARGEGSPIEHPLFRSLALSLSLFLCLASIPSASRFLPLSCPLSLPVSALSLPLHIRRGYHAVTKDIGAPCFGTSAALSLNLGTASPSEQLTHFRCPCLEPSSRFEMGSSTPPAPRLSMTRATSSAEHLPHSDLASQSFLLVFDPTFCSSVLLLSFCSLPHFCSPFLPFNKLQSRPHEYQDLCPSVTPAHNTLGFSAILTT